jgi:hypothetical protein
VSYTTLPLVTHTPGHGGGYHIIKTNYKDGAPSNLKITEVHHMQGPQIHSNIENNFFKSKRDRQTIELERHTHTGLLNSHKLTLNKNLNFFLPPQSFFALLH